MEALPTLLAAAASASGGPVAVLLDATLYLPLGLLLAVILMEMFSGGRQGVDLDKAAVLLLVTASVLFLAGGILVFTQSAALGREAAVRAAGSGVILGIVAAMAAMIKQQIYLQKLMHLARSATRRRHAHSPLAWHTGYFILLLGMLGGGAAAAWWNASTPALSLAQADGSPAAPMSMDPSPSRPAPPRSIPTPTRPEPRKETDFGLAASGITSPHEEDGMHPDIGADDEIPGMAASLPEPTDPEPEEPAGQEADDPSPSATTEPATRNVALDIPSTWDPAALRIFHGSIVPMLRDRCVSCHGEEKQKGDLRLDSPRGIRQGGRGGPVVLAFQPQKSPLHTSITLPADDPDIMPAKGKPLSRSQTNAVRRWIEGGAPMGDGEDEEATRTALAALNQERGGGNSPSQANAVSGNVAKALEAAHIQFSPAGDGLFEIDCSLTRNYPEVSLDLTVLLPIAERIHTLDLSKTKVRDAQLEPVSSMINLRKLLLSQTTIGDEGMAHLAKLENLETINLYGTNVTDAGLEYLSGLGKLKKLYLWNSKATSQGAQRLRRAIPGLDANVGQ